MPNSAVPNATGSRGTKTHVGTPNLCTSVDAIEALAAVDEAELTGRYLEAIEVVNIANRRNRAPQLDRRLVQLRHDAFPELQPSLDLAGWPPPLQDPFPRAKGLVEMPAIELSPEVIGGAILHHGCLLVRGLLPHGVAEHLIEDIDLAFEAHEQWLQRVESDPTDDTPTSPWFEPFAPKPCYPLDLPHLPVVRTTRDYHRVLLADSPPAMFDVLDALERAGLRHLLTGYLGQRPVMTVTRSALRRVPHKFRTIGWHQDAAAFGRVAPSVSCWIALTDCGDDSPGLEVLPLRFDHWIQTPANRLSLDLSTTSFPIAQAVCPRFASGDALLFDDLLVHRTAITDQMTKPRYSIESWFFTARGFPPKDAPVVF